MFRVFAVFATLMLAGSAAVLSMAPGTARADPAEVGNYGRCVRLGDVDPGPGSAGPVNTMSGIVPAGLFGDHSPFDGVIWCQVVPGPLN